jgi:hypothetical protein
LWSQAALQHDFQFGAGFSYTDSSRTPKSNFGGIVYGASWSQNDWLRWVIDGDLQFSGSGLRTIPPASVPENLGVSLDQILFDFHAGPEFRRRFGRATVFLHALPGYTNWGLGSPAEGGFYSVAGTGGFSLAGGGGIDVRLKKHFELRLPQFDYIANWRGDATPNEQLNHPLGRTGGSPVNMFRMGIRFIYCTCRPTE